MKKYNFSGTIILTIGLIGCSKSGNLIGLNQNIKHDDFGYSVTSFEKRDSINSGSSSMKAKGIFLIVTFTVQNDALRVGHKWNNKIAYVQSSDGKKFENNKMAQQLLNASEPFNWQEEYLTPHGVKQSTRLVFDVPDNINQPCLRVSGETLMGDVLNFNRFKRIGIKLY